MPHHTCITSLPANSPNGRRSIKLCCFVGHGFRILPWPDISDSPHRDTHKYCLVDQRDYSECLTPVDGVHENWHLSVNCFARGIECRLACRVPYVISDEYYMYFICIKVVPLMLLLKRNAFRFLIFITIISNSRKSLHLTLDKEAKLICYVTGRSKICKVYGNTGCFTHNISLFTKLEIHELSI